MTQFNALPHQKKWFLGLIDQSCCLLNVILIWSRIRIVCTNKVQLYRLIFHFFRLSILSEIQHNRSGTATLSYIEGTCDSPRYIRSFTNLITPFGNWLCNTNEVDFLKSICSQKSGSYLSSNDHDWRTIDHCICDTCQRICCSRTTCNQTHTHFT